jgi:Uma2 family endonuclease
MNALPQRLFTADDFLAWSESQPGRYELVDGVVVAQAAERASHAEMKLAVCVTPLLSAARPVTRCRTGWPCG